MSETLDLEAPVTKANSWYGHAKPDFLNIDEWLVPTALSESRDLKKSFRKASTALIPFLVESGNIVISQNGFVFSLLSVFGELAKEIEESKSLLRLTEDYDDQGGMPISEATWARAIIFITNYANWIYEKTGKIIDTPQINPGPKESVDILWRNEKYRLLINIPSALNNSVHFYGDNRKGDDNVSGTINENAIQEYFAIWIGSLSKR